MKGLEEWKRVELISGRVVTTAVPAVKHQRVVGRLRNILDDAVAHEGMEAITGTEVSYSLSVWYFRDVDDDDEPTTVNTEDALDALLEDVLANEQPHPTVVVAEGRPTVEPLNLPDHQLKFAADKESGTAAIYLMDARANQAWTTKADAMVSTLWLDREADIAFPRDSAVSLAVLREALHEFMRTAQRPTCVSWQESTVF